MQNFNFKYMESPISYFSGLADPRIERTKAHLLDDIIFIAITSVLCGADTWNDTCTTYEVRVWKILAKLNFLGLKHS